MEFTSKAADYLYGIFHEDPFLCGACIGLAANKVEYLERKQRLTDRTIGARWNTMAELYEMRKVLNAMLGYAMKFYPNTMCCTMDPAFNRHVKA